MAFAIVSRVRSRSKRSCPRSHQPSERPKKRQRRRSVSAVIARRPATISPMPCAGTPISLASRYLEIPMGFRNSSISISPGLTGGSFLALLTTTRVRPAGGAPRKRKPGTRPSSLICRLGDLRPRFVRSKAVPNYLPGSSTLMVKMSSSWVEPFNGKGFTLRVSDQSGCASSSLLMTSPL